MNKKHISKTKILDNVYDDIEIKLKNVKFYDERPIIKSIIFHYLTNKIYIITPPEEYPRHNLGQWTFNYFRNILNNNDITNSNSPADNKSLIYGKYIVVRFVFSNIDNFKLEDITFNIAPFR